MILSASTLLKILLPERQTNKKIYLSFDSLLSNLSIDEWISTYIFWELKLVKELGFDLNITNKNENLKNNTIKINEKNFKIPEFLFVGDNKNYSNSQIKEALLFNKSILIENFIEPNRLRFPYSRNILEKYYN